MCAGIRDAANLAWKLDLVLTGRAGDALLDTYEQERQPSVQRAIELSIGLGKVICVPDPIEAARRDEVMAGAVGPEPVEAPSLPGIDSGLVHPTAPHAGHLFVQGAVGRRPFDEVHGAGWRLVTIDGDIDSLASGARAWFGSIGGQVVWLTEPDRVYRRWFTEHGTAYALQRPDFHLYGTAATAGDAWALLNHLRDRLCPGDRLVLHEGAQP
jgi:hypothetical protein